MGSSGMSTASFGGVISFVTRESVLLGGVGGDNRWGFLFRNGFWFLIIHIWKQSWKGSTDSEFLCFVLKIYLVPGYLETFWLSISGENRHLCWEVVLAHILARKISILPPVYIWNFCWWIPCAIGSFFNSFAQYFTSCSNGSILWIVVISGTIATWNPAAEIPPLFLSVMLTDLPTACPPIPLMLALQC